MGNVFTGGGHSLYLSNGGTDAFLDVLMLAVSDLAHDAWDFRFASLLTLQDQNAVGRGFVGFDLADVDWGRTAAERDRAKGFVLRATDLALRQHRWEELGYEPPFALGYLRRFRAMVEAFDPATAAPRDDVFPGPEEAARACCVRHRVLSALPHWDGCRFCDGSTSDASPPGQGPGARGPSPEPRATATASVPGRRCSPADIETAAVPGGGGRIVVAVAEGLTYDGATRPGPDTTDRAALRQMLERVLLALPGQGAARGMRVTAGRLSPDPPLPESSGASPQPPPRGETVGYPPGPQGRGGHARQRTAWSPHASSPCVIPMRRPACVPVGGRRGCLTRAGESPSASAPALPGPSSGETAMTVRPTLVALAALAALSLTTAAPAAYAADGDAAARSGSERDIARAYAGTAKYAYEPLAVRDGYMRTDECVSDPELGGMGYHYVKGEYINSTDPAKPAALLYEDGPRGRQLVGIEYITIDADQDLSTDDDRPTMFGQPFDGPMEGHEPGMPIHYDLHVWLYKHNPSGTFAQYNPNVHCPED